MLKHGLVNFFETVVLPAIVSLVLVLVFWDLPLLLFFLLLVAGLIMFLQQPTKKDLIIYLFGAIAGVMAEAVGVFSGAWMYTQSTFWGVPLWLFPLWGLASLFIKRLAESF